MGLNYKEKLNLFKDNIVFYDYMDYLDVNNPIIDKSLFDYLPDYYFFGIPIDEFLKVKNSNGRCHTCAFLLSFCFDDCTIYRCNLDSIVKYHNKYEAVSKTDKWHSFKHSFIVFEKNQKEYAIDTTLGAIMPLEIYKKVFDPSDIVKIKSKDIKSTNVYDYLDKNKFVNDSSIEYSTKEFSTFKIMCSQYKSYNFKLNHFFNNDIMDTIYSLDIDEWFYNYFCSNDGRKEKLLKK